MNNADPLNQLHDIVEAQAITWWPLAIGWWFLIIVVLFAITAATIYLIKKHQKLLYKREALHELQELQYRYFASTPDLSSDHGNRDASKLNAEVNVFLKRVLSSQHRNSDFNTQTSKVWKSTLDKELPVLSEREKEILAFGHYTPKAERFDKAFFDSLKKWLRGLR